MHRFSRPLKTGTLFLSVWLATGILFGLSTNAVGPVILFIGLAVAWRRIRPRIARTPAVPDPDPFPTWPKHDHVPRRTAFDFQTQRDAGVPRYHVHYISPSHQRYLEEFYPDPDGLPSLKAGWYLTPIPVTGPRRIDAPPPERPVFIPAQPTNE